MLELRVRGIVIRLSLLFPAALVVMLTLDTSGIPLWCVVASIMHEAGHFLVLLAVGHKPTRICMGAFGIRVEQNVRTPLSYRQNIAVSLAGPLVNLLAFSVLLLTSGWGIPALVHLTLGVFNLLPVEALDGGQALFCWLSLHMEEHTVGKVLFISSLVTILPLAAVGFCMLAESGYNFTLLAVSGYLSLLLLFKRKH